jgi:hypothetical protein
LQPTFWFFSQLSFWFVPQFASRACERSGLPRIPSDYGPHDWSAYGASDYCPGDRAAERASGRASSFALHLLVINHL